MGLEEQLAKVREEFARTAPEEKVALYQANVDELRSTVPLSNAVKLVRTTVEGVSFSCARLFRQMLSTLEVRLSSHPDRLIGHIAAQAAP